MTFVVTVVSRARVDAEQIFNWITDRSPQGASQWASVYHDAIAELKRDADQHGLSPESSFINMPIRQKLFKTRHGRPYRLLFTIDGNEVRVLRVRGPGQAPVRLDEV